MSESCIIILFMNEFNRLRKLLHIWQFDLRPNNQIYESKIWLVLISLRNELFKQKRKAILITSVQSVFSNKMNTQIYLNYYHNRNRFRLSENKEHHLYRNSCCYHTKHLQKDTHNVN
jgi:hypothetical protein